MVGKLRFIVWSAPTNAEKYSVSVDRNFHFLHQTKIRSAAPDHTSTEQSPNTTLYEISKNKLDIDYDKLLGIGEFGWVYQGSIITENRNISVAVKMTRSDRNDSHIKGILSEIHILAYLGKHENIIEMVGAYTSELRSGTVYLMTQLCSLGSLESYLRKHNSLQVIEEHFADDSYEEIMHSTVESISSRDLIRWSHEIACGMEFLGTKNIIHADLATRNVLLTSEKTAKITDFGLSRHMDNYQQYVKKGEDALPWRWMAIESLQMCEYSSQSDVWSFGVTLWEIFSLGDIPYRKMSWTTSFVERLANGFILSCPNYATPEIYTMMKDCWHLNPSERPKFSELMFRTVVSSDLYVMTRANLNRDIGYYTKEAEC